jgi:membrane-bound lytic murein transglycosylase D
MTSSKLLLFLAFLTFSVGSPADEPFPQPPELQADVDFWVDVFTRYGNDEGVLHDSRNLAVVYDRLPMPEKLSSRERQRRVEHRRKELQAVLRSLAKGKRDALQAEEARVLALWPTDVTNETLAAAAGQIRYQQGLKDRFRQGLQRAGRWRDHVNKEFSALNLPIEIAALPHVESSYNPDARSNVGASGIWQFTRSTGQRFMRVDHVVDERNDPFAATRAAARLMAYNYSITGNWPMAITAYNHGLGGVRRAMNQYGDTAYVDIFRKYNGRTFGFASRNFYVAFLAAKEVDQNVEKYFPGLRVESPTRYSVAQLSSYVSVTGLTTALGTTPAKLKEHNPALQATVWQESKYLPKGYELRFPSDGLQRPLAEVLQGLPSSAVFSKQLPDMFHKVVRGDTLSEIAETYDTRVSTLVALNNLKGSNSIRAGQQLRLPAAGPAPVVASVASQPMPEPVIEVPETQPEPGLEILEITPGAMTGDTAAPAPGTAQTSLLSDPSDYSVAADNTIEVQPMETLGHYGDWLEIKTQRLRDLNRLAFDTPVAVGQRIRLDLNTVDAARFEQRRLAYHSALQDSFFRKHVITGVIEHTIKSGESVWVLALRKYQVPIWLFRQYNPGVDMHKVRPGTKVQMPLLSDVESG